MFCYRRISTFLFLLATAPNTSVRSFSPAFVTHSPSTRRNDLSLSASNGREKCDFIDGKSLLRKLQTISGALCTAGVLFLPSSTPSIEQVMGSDPSSRPVLERVTELLHTQPAFAEEDFDKEVLLRRQRSTVLDEVWTMVNKYYVDNTYNGQDWSKVRDSYESRLPFKADGTYDDDEAMKLTNAMVKSLGDKYSRILDRDGYARIQKFDLIGVGATLMPDQDKRIMVGAPPVKNSESDKAGIKYGDFITAVNGVKTEGRTAFDIIDQIADNPNAEVVTMTVLTQGPDDIKGEGVTRDVTMKRQFVEVRNPVSYKISEKRNDGTVVGYIRVSEFNSLVKPKLEEAIKNLSGGGANAYVLDLRGNPGGAFQSAVEIAGLFMDDKVATYVLDSNQVELPFRTTSGKSLVDSDTPIVIWQDGGSASASEVLAGALHDQCRATVMGSNSFGKGLIQAVYGLKNGSGLVLTVARYVTPGGTDIQGTGIVPDISAKLPTPLVIGLSTDTSKVNFNDASSRMKTCVAPTAVATNE